MIIKYKIFKILNILNQAQPRHLSQIRETHLVVTSKTFGGWIQHPPLGLYSLPFIVLHMILCNKYSRFLMPCSKLMNYRNENSKK